MKLQDIFKFSWFANLAYVLWQDDAIGPDPEQGAKAIQYANDPPNQRVPGIATGMVDTLGEKIFNSTDAGGLGWRVLSYSDLVNPAPGAQRLDATGFSASLFEKEDSTHEKVLAIRGTNPDQEGQLYQDLLDADISQIGILGMALSQTVSMVNYINQLRWSHNVHSVMRLELKWSVAGDTPVPPGVNSIAISPGVTMWLDAHYDADGLGTGDTGLISEGDSITVVGHSLGGHLAALAIRLFPSLFDQAVTFNAPGFDPDTGSAGLPAALATLSAVSPLLGTLLAAVAPRGPLQLTDHIVNDLFGSVFASNKKPEASFGGRICARWRNSCLSRIC